MTDKVCAIICNWNNVEDLLNCVDSVLKSTYPNFDLVVVDNGSESYIVNEIREKLPDSVILLINQENKGGAGGFNWGMQYAMDQGVYQSIWLLDNDVVVDPDCLKELVKELRKSVKNGIVGSLILKMKYPDRAQELGAFVDWKMYERIPHLNDFSVDFFKGQVCTVDYVPACSLLVDLEKLKRVGLLDEGYFLYYDDTEWCFRFKNASYHVKATSSAKVWHKSGSSYKKNNGPTYYNWRNQFHFYLNALNSKTEIGGFVKGYIFGQVFSALFTSSKIGKINAFKSIFYGLVDGFAGKRGKVQKDRIFPLDSQVFGQHFFPDHKEIAVIGADFQQYNLLFQFIEGQNSIKLPISFYTNRQKKDFPKKMRELIEVHALDQALLDCHNKDILILLDHILSKSPVLEDKFQQLLENSDSRVFFLDKHCNLYRGYNALRQLREEYLRLKDDIYTSFGTTISSMVSERMTVEKR